MNPPTSTTLAALPRRFIGRLLHRGLARSAAALERQQRARAARAFDALVCEANAMTPGPAGRR